MYTLPFFAESDSLSDLAHTWTAEPWFTLEHTRHQCIFWPEVYSQKPPVIIIGATELQLKTGFIVKLRKATSMRQSLIVALLESEDESFLVDSLQQGADRAISIQRCNARIFCALIKSLLPKTTATTFSYAPYTLNSQTQTVSLDDKHIPLRRRLYEVVHYLFMNNGKMIPKDTLLQEVWGLGDDGHNTRRVEQQVSLAKRQLALDGTHGWRLRASRGRNRGYGVFRDPVALQNSSRG